MSRYLHDFFHRHGVDEKDVPRAFVLYKLLGVGVSAACYAVCYRYRPLQRAIMHEPFAGWYGGFQRAFPNFHSRATNFIDTKSTAIATSRYFHPVANSLGLESKRATIAIGEAFVFDKFAMFLTTPLQFYLTLKWMKSRDSHPDAKGAVKTSVGVLRSKKSVVCGHHRSWSGPNTLP